MIEIKHTFPTLDALRAISRDGLLYRPSSFAAKLLLRDKPLLLKRGTQHVISLGAGVQSSTLSVLTALGFITPMPLFGMFADTQNEPRSVYVWLHYLCGCDLEEREYIDDQTGKTHRTLAAIPGTYQKGILPFPVVIVSRGDLFADATRVRVARKGPNIGRRYVALNLPVFARNADGSKSGMVSRHCTADYKIRLINQELKKRVAKNSQVTQWIGISTDEALRMKPARDKQMVNIWPLIDMGLSRDDCKAILRALGLSAPKSACRGCPYHSDAQWLEMKTDEPDEFAIAVIEERALQLAVTKQEAFKGTPYLHKDRVPLDQVKFNPNAGAVFNLFEDGFNNECEGMCGV